MKYSIALSIAAIAAGVSAQGEATGKAPPGGNPQGCQLTGTGQYLVKFEQPPTAGKRSLEKRQAGTCGAPDALVVQLNNGVLTDKQGRIGSVVANRQFQFDGPPAQTGAIYTGGFSLCSNGSIALGQNYNFYQSLSGTFYNIYDQPQRSDSILVNMNVIPCSGSSSSGSAAPSGAASVQPDGQPTASQAPVASQQPDGQPTAGPAPTAAASQISDGQVQATSAVASQISDGQVQATQAPNATVTTAQPPIATGGAAALAGSGAIVAIGAAVALFL